MMLILFFLYLFGPVFNSISPIIDTIFFVSLFLCAWGVRGKVRIRNSYAIFSMLFVVSFYSTVSLLLLGDLKVGVFLQSILSPVRALITLVAGAYLVKLCLEKGYTEKEIVTYAITASALHAAIMLLQLLFPEFKDAIYSYTTNFNQVGYENYTYGYNFRMGGLSGGTGSAILSVTMAIPILFMPQAMRSSGVLERIYLLFLALLIVSAVLISGRSGLMVLIFLTPIAVYLHQRIVGRVHGVMSFFGYLLVLGVTLFWVLASIAVLDDQSDLYYAVTRTMETLLNFERGNYSDNTINVLSSHVIFPESIEIWLLGDPAHLAYTQADRLLNSDIGIIRNIWSLGVFVSVIYWFPYMYLMAISLKGVQTSAGVNLFLVVLVSIVFQFKEDVLYSRILCSFLGLALGVFYFRMNYITIARPFKRS